MTDQDVSRNPVEVLGEEFLERRRRGEPASVQEYAAAHPELADQICQLFPAMVAMEQFKTHRTSSSEPSIEMQVEKLEQLGDYRIIGEIGRGGMGVVFEAEQQSLVRRVAVKVFPRQALRDPRQLKRFFREARTAARLHHTNIVPVFGVGEQDGLHYFVMQRIQGISLDRFLQANSASKPVDAERQPREAAGGPAAESDEIDSNPLARALQRRSPWRRVAQIGVQVADALAYAHAQGVLHRDIKPSNLLLDAQGTVWITDFGLATMVESEKISHPGDVVGTLRFMAPEHLRGEQDARTDVYSLGLTLYELLTLQPAFGDGSRAKLIQKILSGERTSPRKLRPEIPRDLEAIVLMATAPEPKRRYQTAAALAADLRQFLQGRPVRARRVGSAGRVWRWVGRDPAIASLTAALLLVVLFSFVLISKKWREAVLQRHRAEENMSLALESIGRILEPFASSWRSHPTALHTEDSDAVFAGAEYPTSAADNSAVLEDALKFYDRFARQNTQHPQPQRDNAHVHRRVADIYHRLGHFVKARDAYRRSLDILDAIPDQKEPTLAVERASALNQLGRTMYATSQFSEAAAEYRRAKQILDEMPHKDRPQPQFELARTNNNLGQALWFMRQREEARQSHHEAVRVLEKLVRNYARNPDFRLELARAYRTYYPFEVHGGLEGDHERIRASGIAILEELVSEFPNVPDYQCELSEMLTVTAARRRQDEPADQHPRQLTRAVTLARSLSERYPSIPRYRVVLARALKELAWWQCLSERDQADRRYADSVAIYRSLAIEFSDIPVYHTFLAIALHDQAQNLREMGRTRESREIIQESIAEQQVYLELRPNSYSGKKLLERLNASLDDTG